MTKNSRVDGHSKELAGTVKQGVGKLIGNAKMESAGTAEVAHGQAEVAAVKSSERVVGAGEKLGGTVKEIVGEHTNNPTLISEGHADVKKGKRRQNANQ